MEDLTKERAIVGHLLQAYELSPAELKVAHLLLKGYSNMEIAQVLGLKVSSIKFQITRIYKRTGKRSRADFLTSFYEAFRGLLSAQNGETTALAHNLNHQLFIGSTTMRSKSQIITAWNTTIAPSLPQKVQQSLLNKFLDALNLN